MRGDRVRPTGLRPGRHRIGADQLPHDARRSAAGDSHENNRPPRTRRTGASASGRRRLLHVARPDQVRVRVFYAPIHPGDLLGIMGSPAFGTPPTIASGGRVPGFEGAGVVSEVGAKVNPALGLKQGLRLAFFPASDEAVVPASSVVPLLDSIPDEVGAQMLINTLMLTGAGSAVGRLIGKALAERGVKIVRLVRSEASAAKLIGILPGPRRPQRKTRARQHRPPSSR